MIDVNFPRMTNLSPHGKLLLTGEYFVLDGVPALAVPTRLGQSFVAAALPGSPEHDLLWRAYNVDGECWFSHHFDKEEWARPQVQSEDPAARIRQILHAAETLNPGCTQQIRGVEVTTRLQFDRKWGLGSSSTLIAGVARWERPEQFFGRGLTLLPGLGWEQVAER